MTMTSLNDYGNSWSLLTHHLSSGVQIQDLRPGSELDPSLADTDLALHRLPVLLLLDDGQLQLGHLLHLSIHVDLVQQRAALAAQEVQRVLLPLALRQLGRARRVDRRHPVLQVGLAGGLDGDN